MPAAPSGKLRFAEPSSPVTFSLGILKCRPNASCAQALAICRKASRVGLSSASSAQRPHSPASRQQSSSDVAMAHSTKRHVTPCIERRAPPQFGGTACRRSTLFCNADLVVGSPAAASAPVVPLGPGVYASGLSFSSRCCGSPQSRVGKGERPSRAAGKMTLQEAPDLTVPGERIELPTNGLQNRCSTAELTRQINGLRPSR